ncbi:hypothetical protein L1987_49915 [Smallanthus sonchifolius]|uniref:Uncharacterized protein n=1 Tax=Smallanthus sonchifolius TaxID=185202 RepID=A0ACB9FVS4_9ASTR|nr:hypothetical protein L1987_49915 [Smallanthus sonchifolius]
MLTDRPQSQTHESLATDAGQTTQDKHKDDPISLSHLTQNGSEKKGFCLIHLNFFSVPKIMSKESVCYKMLKIKIWVHMDF